jgi:hypothetical protein
LSSTTSTAPLTPLSGAVEGWHEGERPISGFEGPGAELRAAVFADGGELPIEALLVKTTLYQRSSLARDLGASLTEPDEMLGVEAIKDLA